MDLWVSTLLNIVNRYKYIYQSVFENQKLKKIKIRKIMEVWINRAFI